MPTYRAVVSKTTVTREVVTINASDILNATHRLQAYVDKVPSARRAVTVTQTHDEDRKATEDFTLLSVREA